MYPQNATF